MRKTLSESVKGFLARRPHIVLVAVAIPMLLLALGRWPYAYYKVLRWVTCSTAVVMACVAWTAWEEKGLWAVLPFGLLAILFNPLLPIHLNREVWRVLNLGAAAALAIGVVVIRLKRES